MSSKLGSSKNWFSEVLICISSEKRKLIEIEITAINKRAGKNTYTLKYMKRNNWKLVDISYPITDSILAFVSAMK